MTSSKITPKIGDILVLGPVRHIPDWDSEPWYFLILGFSKCLNLVTLLSISESERHCSPIFCQESISNILDDLENIPRKSNNRLFESDVWQFL